MIVHAYLTRDELIHRDLGLVNRVVDKYWRVPAVRQLGREEAEGVGYLALVRAAEDYQYGGPFTHFAFLYVRNAVLHEARSHRQAESLPDPDRLPCRSRAPQRRSSFKDATDLLDKLPNEEFHLLSRAYGVGGRTQETVAELAKAHGVTPRTMQSRLRSARAVAKARHGSEPPQL